MEGLALTGRDSSLHWSRGKKERMCRCKCAHRFGKGRVESSFLVVLVLPVKEKSPSSVEGAEVGYWVGFEEHGESGSENNQKQRILHSWNHSPICKDTATAEHWSLQLGQMTVSALSLDSGLCMPLLGSATIPRSQMVLPSLLFLERILQFLCLFVSLSLDAKSQKEISNLLSPGHAPMLPYLPGEPEKLAFSASKLEGTFCSQQVSYGGKGIQILESPTNKRQTPSNMAFTPAILRTAVAVPGVRCKRQESLFTQNWL